MNNDNTEIKSIGFKKSRIERLKTIDFREFFRLKVDKWRQFRTEEDTLYKVRSFLVVPDIITLVRRLIVRLFEAFFTKEHPGD